jgi:hypothetical protein
MDRCYIGAREEVMVRWVEFSGYVASSLVFLTFYMRGMASLRLIALCSNAAFLIYAGSLHLLPILLLHGALIPVNACRLRTAWQSGTLPDFLSATGSSGTNSMNYRAFTNDSLAMMYAGIRGSLAVDDALVGQGEETRFRVRETADWKRHAADLETEMIRREMAFEVIDWSRRPTRVGDDMTPSRVIPRGNEVLPKSQRTDAMSMQRRIPCSLCVM